MTIREPVDSVGQVELNQFNILTTLWMFTWPAVWYTFLIYGIGKLFTPPGETTPTWYLLLTMCLGSGAELTVGLFLLRREGYKLTLDSLRDRIRFHWPCGWKNWIWAIVALILGLSLSIAMGSVNRMLAETPGFAPPNWWPAASNPTIEVRGVADYFPDVELSGNYLFLFFYFVIGLVFNAFGEELYYRGYLLPRMRGVFGRWDWVANGILFTLKHIYQRWLYPAILVGGLTFAFAAGPLGSLPLAMAFHWIGNFLIQMVFLFQAVFASPL